MSKIVKGVKKVFKKVIKVVKKIAPVILAAAAIYFTAGAALGFSTTAFSGALTSAGATFGQGIIGGVVRGAIVSAAKGAAIGGITSVATGGSFRSGAEAGAVTGAVIGGVTGGLGARAAAGSVDPVSGVRTFPSPNAPPLGAGGAVNAGNAMNVSSYTPKPGLFQAGGWLERNGDLAGGLMKGVGQGMAAGAAAEGDLQLQREKFSLTADNYAGTDPGRNYRSFAGGTGESVFQQVEGGLAKAKDRYDPKTYGSFEYQYDPEQGRIIKVPAG